MSEKTFTMEEVKRHNTAGDCWVVVDGVVYDVTRFLSVHPGGRGVLLKMGGCDATTEFYDFHSKEVLAKMGSKLRIGTIGAGGVGAVDGGVVAKLDEVTPFGESTAFRGWKSPYFKEKHFRVKLAVREFIHETLLPLVEHCEDANEDPPAEAFLVLGKAGILAARMGAAVAPFVEQAGIKLPGNLLPGDLDYFTRYIVNSEFYRNLPAGLSDGLSAGINIGLPPILYFGSDELKARFVIPILRGERRVALAITEASGGSDVAALKTTAKLTPDGKHYVVNGVKRWITSGNCADVFVTVCRTGKSGHGGLSFLVIERGPGVTTSKMKTSYSGSASTAVVIFENVLVPVENLLGAENAAFKMIMANFNQERWLIVHSLLAPVRCVLADCYRWAMQRKAFGKRLIDQPVIRYKLAEMSAAVESLDAWSEALTYQMETMSFAEQSVKLAAPIALLKFHTTRTCVMLADNACQIFGGRAITRTGMGKRIEQFQRMYKIGAIYGGSEEIMADVAVRQEVARLDARIAKGDLKALTMSRL